MPQSLDLASSLRIAVENNHDIRLAKQRLEEQNGLIMEVRARALPDLTVNGRYLELDEGLSEGNQFFPPSTTQWSLALNVRQTLYAGGGVRAALNVQQLVEESAILELEGVVDDVLLATRQGYYDALLAREEIEVQEENVELLEELLANEKERFEVGSGSKYDVLRAEVELANARPSLIQARSDYRLALEVLRQLMGVSGTRTEGFELNGELPYSPKNYELVDALREAVTSRSEVLQLEKIHEGRKEGVVIARSGYRPEVSLIGSYQFDKSSYSSSFDDSLDGWTAGVEVRVPIFDGMKTKGQVAQAKSQEQQAALEVEKLKLAVEVEVRRAFSDLQTAKELAEASIKVVGQAEEALRLVDVAYGAGDSSQLDLLQARVSLTEARLNQAQAFYRYALADAQMRRAIGRSDEAIVE